jgi:hypothetical protein
MSNKQVRVVGKRRAEIDISRLAEALLDYIESLSETETRSSVRGGEGQLKRSSSPAEENGSAA